MATGVLRDKRSWKKGISLTACIIVGVILLFPVYWMALTSLLPTSAILSRNPTFLPSPADLNISSYVTVATERPIVQWLWNSTLVTIPSAIISTLISALAAYSLSRFKTKGQGAMGYTLLFGRMLPGTLLIIPLFVLFAGFGLVDRIGSLVLVNVAATVPFTTWMLKGFFDSIPVDLEEAARVDGCTRLQSLRRVIVPLARPGVAASLTYASILAWGDFLFARTLMTEPSGWTVTVGIASFAGQYTVDWGGMMATGLISVLPLFVLFLALEPYLVSGMTSGSVKG